MNTTGAPGDMRNLLASWQFWAILSAGFASLAAIFRVVLHAKRQLGLRDFYPNPDYYGPDGRYADYAWSVAHRKAADRFHAESVE